MIAVTLSKCEPVKRSRLLESPSVRRRLWKSNFRQSIFHVLTYIHTRPRYRILRIVVIKRNLLSSHMSFFLISYLPSATTWTTPRLRQSCAGVKHINFRMRTVYGIVRNRPGSGSCGGQTYCLTVDPFEHRCHTIIVIKWTVHGSSIRAETLLRVWEYAWQKSAAWETNKE